MAYTKLEDTLIKMKTKVEYLLGQLRQGESEDEIKNGLRDIKEMIGELVVGGPRYWK